MLSKHLSNALNNLILFIWTILPTFWYLKNLIIAAFLITCLLFSLFENEHEITFDIII